MSSTRGGLSQGDGQGASRVTRHASLRAWDRVLTPFAGDCELPQECSAVGSDDNDAAAGSSSSSNVSRSVLDLVLPPPPPPPPSAVVNAAGRGGGVEGAAGSDREQMFHIFRVKSRDLWPPPPPPPRLTPTPRFFSHLHPSPTTPLPPRPLLRCSAPAC